MEMEMMGCQIPAFGMWNYCNDLSITQYFDSAMQARLMKRCWNRRGSDAAAAAAAVVVGEKAGVACGDEQLVLFRTPSFQRKPAAQIKVIRREVEKHCDGNESQDGGGVQADEVVAYSVKRKVIISKAVDEDLYKVPQPPMYQKPRKMRKVVWSMWIGCLGLDCVA
ncbi:hypothetical protein BDA96_10G117400 [Sorghum bicolor]|uniref:Uncharacterized protein n=1 Tax=Sorghum bicolor TaxID=4558 RepID=A0A921Q2A7_SORBI|nr:uncharacterized protein LOC8057889 isoform X2 [Sorghum bicolor]KAG0513616.1 hypothetical protein BDA96_10G117400 [Sorghum bicolor]|eukprot:XP_021306166.1 uncharacterized protein LOC8057889 isoform X2 [Sorghum bicolor]